MDVKNVGVDFNFYFIKMMLQPSREVATLISAGPDDLHIQAYCDIKPYRPYYGS